MSVNFFIELALGAFLASLLVRGEIGHYLFFCGSLNDSLNRGGSDQVCSWACNFLLFRRVVLHDVLE